MIGSLINMAIILPLLIGIISVDISGNPTSIREFLRSDLMQNATSVVKNVLPTNPPNGEDIEEIEEEKEPVQPIINIDLRESYEALNNFNKSVAEGVIFLVFHTKDFGVWLGVHTAPFHYLLAVLVAFSFLSPYNWLWIGSIFWVITVERKEVYNIFKTGIRDAHVRRQVRLVAIEIGSGIKYKLRRKKQ